MSVLLLQSGDKLLLQSGDDLLLQDSGGGSILPLLARDMDQMADMDGGMRG